MSTADLSPGLYQAEIAGMMQPGGVSPAREGETVVLFRLTEPNKEDKRNPQIGLGGRVARAHYALEHPNPATAEEARERLSGLLTATGADTLDETIGSIVWIRVARAILQSDPSRYQTIVVEVLPLFDPRTREFVQ